MIANPKSGFYLDHLINAILPLDGIGEWGREYQVSQTPFGNPTPSMFPYSTQPDTGLT